MVDYLLPEKMLFSKPLNEIIDHMYTNKMYVFCDTSIEYLKRAIDQENTKAMFILGRIYIEQRINDSDIIRFGEIGIAKGDINLITLLGTFYNRSGNFQKGLECYTDAAAKGSVKAMYKVFKTYLNDQIEGGFGTYRDKIMDIDISDTSEQNIKKNRSIYKYKCKTLEKLALYYKDLGEVSQMISYYNKIIDSYVGIYDEVYSYKAIKSLGNYYEDINNGQMMVLYYKKLFINPDYDFHISLRKRECSVYLMNIIYYYSDIFKNSNQLELPNKMEILNEAIEISLIGLNLFNKRKIMVKLARFYKYKEDYENMFKYLHMAINQKNCTKSMYIVGLYCESHNLLDKALNYYINCIKAGNNISLNNLNRLIEPFKQRAETEVKYLHLFFIVSCITKNIVNIFKYYKIILTKITDVQALAKYRSDVLQALGQTNMIAAYFFLQNISEKTAHVNEFITTITEKLVEIYGEGINEYLTKEYPNRECPVCFEENIIRVPIIINRTPLQICPHQLCVDCHIQVDKCPLRCGLKR